MINSPCKRWKEKSPKKMKEIFFDNKSSNRVNQEKVNTMEWEMRLKENPWTLISSHSLLFCYATPICIFFYFECWVKFTRSKANSFRLLLQAFHRAFTLKSPGLDDVVHERCFNCKIRERFSDLKFVKLI